MSTPPIFTSPNGSSAFSRPAASSLASISISPNSSSMSSTTSTSGTSTAGTTPDGSRVQSPRPETPEPYSKMGRRNARPGVQLLDDEGGISDELEFALKHIFAKYCTPTASKHPTSSPLLQPPADAVLTSSGLDKWAIETNGKPFSDETKEELKDFMDVDDSGNLTFKGFLQIYQLQTENDEEETWRDLSNHGFDRTLNLVSSRREDMEEEATVTLGLPSEKQQQPVKQKHSPLANVISVDGEEGSQETAMDETR